MPQLLRAFTVGFLLLVSSSLFAGVDPRTRLDGDHCIECDQHYYECHCECERCEKPFRICTGKGKGSKNSKGAKAGAKRKTSETGCIVNDSCCRCHQDPNCSVYCHRCYRRKANCACHSASDKPDHGPDTKRYKPALPLDNGLLLRQNTDDAVLQHVMPQLLTATAPQPVNPLAGESYSGTVTLHHQPTTDSLSENGCCEETVNDEDPNDGLSILCDHVVLSAVETEGFSAATILQGQLDQFPITDETDQDTLFAQVLSFPETDPTTIELTTSANLAAGSYLMLVEYKGKKQLLLVIANGNGTHLLIYRDQHRKFRIVTADKEDFQEFIIYLLEQDVGPSAVNTQPCMITVSAIHLTLPEVQEMKPIWLLAEAALARARMDALQMMALDEDECTVVSQTQPLISQSGASAGSSCADFDIGICKRFTRNYDYCATQEHFFIDRTARRRIAVMIRDMLQCPPPQVIEVEEHTFQLQAELNSNQFVENLPELSLSGQYLVILHPQNDQGEPLLIFLQVAINTAYLSLNTFSNRLNPEASSESIVQASLSDILSELIALNNSGEVDHISIYAPKAFDPDTQD